MIYVLKKFQELEKLKSLLLNPDQLSLFEFIPKPVLKNIKDAEEEEEELDIKENGKERDVKTEIVSNFRKFWTHSLQEDTSFRRLQIAKAYTRLVKKDNKSRMDKKLIAIFEVFLDKVNQGSVKELDDNDDKNEEEN